LLPQFHQFSDQVVVADVVEVGGDHGSGGELRES
jgi:hypothetical protein